MFVFEAALKRRFKPKAHGCVWTDAICFFQMFASRIDLYVHVIWCNKHLEHLVGGVNTTFSEEHWLCSDFERLGCLFSFIFLQIVLLSCLGHSSLPRLSSNWLSESNRIHSLLYQRTTFDQGAKHIRC